MTEVMRSRNSKDRQYNGQKIRDRQCSTKINVTMDNPEKLTTQGTQDEEKQNKNTTQCGHHYAQINTNNVNMT